MATSDEKKPFDWSAWEEKHNRRLLELTFAECPEDVDAIPGCGPDFPAGWYVEKPAKSKSNAERMAALEKQRQDNARLLERTKERYRRVRLGDLSMLSNYDRNIAHGGSRAMAIRGELRQAHAHVSFYRSVLAEIDRQLDAAREAVNRDRAQMALF